MPKISPFIQHRKKVSYALESHEEHFQIDCSAGSNPYGFSPLVREALEHLKNHEEAFYEYPHGTELKKAIVEYWAPYVHLDEGCVSYCGGSIDGIYMINQLFQRDGAAVLGFCPQFTEYVLNARMLGYSYKGVPLLREDAYKFHADSLLESITPDLSLIYLDNPNNPTGQVIPLPDLRRILEKARKMDICVVADEAYGDYMPRSESAATLLGEFGNLMVLRTFSKGLGLAGLRAGYLLTSEDLSEQFDKISNPYVIPQPSRILAQAALRDIAFVDGCCEAFVQSKAAIRHRLGGRLRIAHTWDACPILLLWHVDRAVDLSTEFAIRGVKVYSGSDFETLEANSVRLRLPHRDQMEPLLKAVEEIGG